MMVMTDSIKIYNQALHAQSGQNQQTYYQKAQCNNYNNSNSPSADCEYYYVDLIKTMICELVTKRESDLLSALCSVNKIKVEVVNFTITYSQCTFKSTYDLLPIIQGLNTAFSKNIYERQNEPKDDYYLLKPKASNIEPKQDLRKIPLEAEEDILGFLASYGRLEDWEIDVINIVREETSYFIPQIETKIMNEGWASFWHYNILQRLELSQGLHIEFLKRHNQVIKPVEGRINPYYIGFKVFEYLHDKYTDNPHKIFEVREIERDQSFLRRYLTFDMCRETNLFEYIRVGNEYMVTETSDEEGWEKIRNTLADSAGIGGLPVIRVIEWVIKDNTLILEHVYDGRELDINYACETLKHIADLWEGAVILSTMVDDRRTTITCDESKKITTGMI